MFGVLLMTSTNSKHMCPFSVANVRNNVIGKKVFNPPIFTFSECEEGGLSVMDIQTYRLRSSSSSSSRTVLYLL